MSRKPSSEDYINAQHKLYSENMYYKFKQMISKNYHSKQIRTFLQFSYQQKRYWRIQLFLEDTENKLPYKYTDIKDKDVGSLKTTKLSSLEDIYQKVKEADNINKVIFFYSTLPSHCDYFYTDQGIDLLGNFMQKHHELKNIITKIILLSTQSLKFLSDVIKDPIDDYLFGIFNKPSEENTAKTIFDNWGKNIGKIPYIYKYIDLLSVRDFIAENPKRYGIVPIICDDDRLEKVKTIIRLGLNGWIKKITSFDNTMKLNRRILPRCSIIVDSFDIYIQSGICPKNYTIAKGTSADFEEMVPNNPSKQIGKFFGIRELFKTGPKLPNDCVAPIDIENYLVSDVYTLHPFECTVYFKEYRGNKSKPSKKALEEMTGSHKTIEKEISNCMYYINAMNTCEDQIKNALQLLILRYCSIQRNNNYITPKDFYQPNSTIEFDTSDEEYFIYGNYTVPKPKDFPEELLREIIEEKAMLEFGLNEFLKVRPDIASLDRIPKNINDIQPGLEISQLYFEDYKDYCNNMRKLFERDYPIRKKLDLKKNYEIQYSYHTHSIEEHPLSCDSLILNDKYIKISDLIPYFKSHICMFKRFGLILDDKNPTIA